MSSMLQDSQISTEFRQENNIPSSDSAPALQLLAALQLNSTSIHGGNHQVTTMAQCSNCVSNKRQSPSDLSPEQPSSKRAAIQEPSFSASPFGDQLLQNGFSKIRLPSSGLSRALSAPIPTKNLYDQFSDSGLANSLVNIPLPEPKKDSWVNSEPVPKQPPEQSEKPLYRTYSEPIPEASQAVSTSAAPRPLAAGKVTRRPGFGLKPESPDTKRFRKMKDRLRDISNWWSEVIKENDEEEEDAGSENNDHCPPKHDCEASQGSETDEASHDQEAVWVERKGEFLILHFKCPCNKGYQILLSGNNCYYKLSSF